MDKATFINRFVNDLLTLGVRPGGVLLVHPALRPFGYVPGGANTVIEALLITLGERGTLLMPALSWENVTPKNPIFDLNLTPSCVGVIAETFRLDPRSQRSLHPTHSVCGSGPSTETIISNHLHDHTPCGPNSPFHQLPTLKGQILMLACDLIYNTSMHAIEELVEPPYLYDPPIRYSLTDGKGHRLEKEYIPHNFKGWIQRYDRVGNIMERPGLCSGLVVGVKSYLIEAQVLWKAAYEMLTQDPLYFIDRDEPIIHEPPIR
jgi:aminoglycoside 3-N-acetyltransferase